MKSVGYYTESLNTGVEYAVREDGAVFSREKYHNGRFFTKSKWKRDDHFREQLASLPASAAIGFASRGQHTFIASTRLKLPQDGAK